MSPGAVITALVTLGVAGIRAHLISMRRLKSCNNRLLGCSAAAGAVLARCRWEGGDREEAVLELARSSRDDLAAAGEGATEDLAEIEAWLSRRGVRHEVQAAMHVGVGRLHRPRHRVDHRPRFLRRGGVVEVDQRLAVDLLRQDRELRPDRLDVVGGLEDGCVHLGLSCRA